MKRRTTLLAAGVFVLALAAGCGQTEQARENLEKDDRLPGDAAVAGESGAAGERIVVGGFEIEGPDGSSVEVPEVTVERADVEEYLGEVRPVVESTVRDLSGVIRPDARLEDGRLNLGVDVESIQQARQAARNGLNGLREVQPPADLEPIHERLVNTYERTLPAYDTIIGAFGSGDVGALTAAVRQSLPELERSAAESRSILQELERAAERRSGTGQGV